MSEQGERTPVAGFQLEPEELAAAGHLLEMRAAQSLFECRFGNSGKHLGPEHLNGADPAAREQRAQVPAEHFDFREFRHASEMARTSHKPDRRLCLRA
jgi:hypothetical protein